MGSLGIVQVECSPACQKECVVCSRIVAILQDVSALQNHSPDWDTP